MPVERMIAVIALCALLVGCQADATAPAVDDPRIARLAAYDAQRIRVLGDSSAGIDAMPLTDAAQMPDTGDVAYAGSAIFTIITDPAVTQIAGDAAITVSFGTGGMTGTFDNFFGVNSADELVDYDGDLSVSGTVGGAEPNEFTATYVGTLTQAGDTIGFDGDLAGQFHGAGASAMSAGNLDGTVMYNDLATDMTLVVVAEAE